MKLRTLTAIIGLLLLQGLVLLVLGSGVMGPYDREPFSLLIYFLAGTWFFAIGAAILALASLISWITKRPDDVL